jgi:hypothetical protein
MERRQYIPVGLTAASMRPTSMQKTSPDRKQPYRLSPVYVSLNNWRDFCTLASSRGHGFLR